MPIVKRANTYNKMTGSVKTSQNVLQKFKLYPPFTDLNERHNINIRLMRHKIVQHLTLTEFKFFSR